MNGEKENAPPRAARGGYLFIPKNLQRADIIIWLRRSHAWTGVFGAVLFFCFGLTGLYLNHERHWKLEGGRMLEVASLDVAVDPAAIGSLADLADWMRSEFQISGQQTGARRNAGGVVMFDGRAMRQPDTFNVQFRGPNALVIADYQLGSNTVSVTRRDASLLKALIHLHVSSGAGKAYILLADTIAGALMFMSLSGVLLWTRLHGGRLIAIGILGSLIVWLLLSVGSAWLHWAAP
ncbi:MAG: PepSY-associated TM helix domain-containing protein [Parvularculaceae bacterium]|nr:PepSY-associated TM helix domain-containing protein [Parvularculaceae bacterium]